MTNLFLEYENNKKTKDNPELLVGQTRYWNKTWLGKDLRFETRNEFLVESYDQATNICRIKYLMCGFCGGEYPENIINNSTETLDELALNT